MFLKISALSLFTLGLCVSLPAVAQEQREWQDCQHDTDCVIVGGGCILGAVNQRFKAEGAAYYAAENAKVKCLRYLDPATATTTCTHSKVPCLDEGGGVDPASTCLSKKAKCTVVEQLAP